MPTQEKKREQTFAAIFNVTKNKYVQLTDGVLDGLYLSSSMVSYATDCDASNLAQAKIQYANFHHSADLPFALMEMFFLTCFSIIAKGADKSYKNKSGHRYLFFLMMITWPYVRDTLSGLKNGRHAVINTSGLISHLSQGAVYHTVNPIGIGIGVLLAINLIYYRRMNKQRDSMIQANQALLQSICDKHLIDDSIAFRIKKYSATQRTLHYLSASFHGLTDGMYLYGCLFVLIGLGVTTLTGGAPFIAACIAISLITLCSWVTRVEEEYQAQKELRLSQLDCHIALTENKIIDNPTNTTLTEKILNLQQQKASYNAPPCSCAAKPPLLIRHGIFYVGRGLISGAKNANAAINSIKACLSNWAINAVLSVVAITTSVLYAGYLALGALGEKIDSKKKQPQCLPPAELNSLQTTRTIITLSTDATSHNDTSNDNPKQALMKDKKRKHHTHQEEPIKKRKIDAANDSRSTPCLINSPQQKKNVDSVSAHTIFKRSRLSSASRVQRSYDGSDTDPTRAKRQDAS